MRRPMMAGFGLVLALMLGLGLFGIALAHAKLASSTPKAGERLTAAPTKVTLVFTEEVSDQESQTYFTVTDAKGTQVGSGKLDNTDVNHETQSGTLQSGLSDGVYTVSWHTVTPDDNGISSGTFTFGVNADPGPQSNVEGTEQEEATAAPTGAATAAPTTAPTTAATSASQPTRASTTQPTAHTTPAAQATTTPTGITTTLPNTGDGDSPLPIYVFLFALIAVVGGVALRYATARLRR